MATFLNDTLTDTTNVALTAHTGETGATWTAASVNPGNWRFDTTGSRLFSDDAGVVLASGTPAGADYDVVSTFHRYTNASGTGAIVGRYIEASQNGYVGGYLFSSSQWVIWRMDAGTRTVIGSYAQAITSGTDYTITLGFRGSTISLKIDGIERVSVTDATYSAAGRVGFYASGTWAAASVWGPSSISATDAVPPSAAPVVSAGADATITAGQALTRTATFTDADSSGPFTATVDYGEGAGPVAVTPGAGTVALSNVYEAVGVYTVTVSVTDETDSTGSDTATVTVNEAPTIGSFVVADVTGTDASAPTISLS